MKKYLPFLFLCLITCFSLFSCKKNNDIVPTSEPSIVGKWKMVLYIDSAANTSETKEESLKYGDMFTPMIDTAAILAGSVEMQITFKDSSITKGSITGHTIKNGFMYDFIITSIHHIHFSSKGWTLAVDPRWGRHLADILGWESDCTYYFDALNRLFIHSQQGNKAVFERKE